MSALFRMRRKWKSPKALQPKATGLNASMEIMKVR